MSEGDSSDLGAPPALKEDYSSMQQQQGEGDGTGTGTGTGTGKSVHHGINGGGGGGNDDDCSSSDGDEVDTITSLSLFRRGGDGFGAGGRIIPVRKRPAAKSLIRRTHHRRARIRQQQEIQDEGDLFSIKITATTTTSAATATNTTSTTKSSPVKKKPKSTKKTTTTTGVTGSSTSSSKQTRKSTRGGPPVPEWEGKPDEPLEGGWPDGWVKRIYLRKGGATAGQKDRYWFSPNNFKLRSMVEVKKFMKALQQYNGDEKLASKSYKKIQL